MDDSDNCQSGAGNPERNFFCFCCGWKSMTEETGGGSYEICQVCFWEDDGSQDADPEYAGGANEPCLYDCRANYDKYGAVEERFKSNVKQPHELGITERVFRPRREDEPKPVPQQAASAAEQGENDDSS